MRVMLAVAAVLFGCASAGGSDHIIVPDGGGGGGGGGQHDAPMGRMDASPDAPNGMVSTTLTETTNNTIFYGGSFACACSNGAVCTAGNTTDNIWYRAYQLSDFNITNAFTITSVTFGVQDAVSSPPVTVKVTNFTGTLDSATVTAGSLLGMAQVTPPNTNGMTGEMVNVNLNATVAAGGKFLVEISAPDVSNAATTQALYIGATSSGETHRGYWSSAGCSQSTPETSVAAGATGQFIISVTGTH